MQMWTSHIWALLFLALSVFSACAEPTTDQTPDGDLDSDVSGESDIQESDNDESLTVPHKHALSCSPDHCRDGFTPPPECVVPDFERMQQGLKYTTCETDADCLENEKCIYATPEWICVAAQYPNWLGIYEFGDECAFDPIADITNTYSVMGAWVQDGQPMWLEQNQEEGQTRLCQRNGCTQTVALESATLITVVDCPVAGGTVALMQDDSTWPQSRIAYRIGRTGLSELGRVSENPYYYIENGKGGDLVCTENGELILVTPTRLMRYQNGSFTRMLPIDALVSTFPNTSASYGAFDGVRPDAQNPNLLHIGIAASYAVFLIDWEMDEGIVWKKAMAQTDWQTRALPGANGRWLIGSGNQFYASNRGLEPKEWFLKSENETVIGMDADGGALTRTITRIFRRSAKEGSLPVAVDAGLLFPAEYKYYVPAIRQIFHQVQGDEDFMTLVLQYRPTGGQNNPQNPNEGEMD